MKIDIIRIADRGVSDKERLHLRANADLRSNYYAVYETFRTAETKIRTGGRRAYWFENKEIKAGDTIILYTRSGEYSVRENDDGTKTHFFYWGLYEALWTTSASAATLLELTTWSTSPAMESLSDVPEDVRREA